MTRKTIDSALCGAICLVFGWGASTLLHEAGHFAVAGSLDIPASFGKLTLTTGSVFVQGSLTNMQTVLIAVAGSLVLVIAGVLMVRLSAAPAVRMIGIIFLCRAWVDILPITGLDGGLIAGSAGYVIAMIIVIAEVLICGSIIFEAMLEGNDIRV